MKIHHHMIWQSIEVVTVRDAKTYVVDRYRNELRNIEDPTDRLPLQQRQSGRTPAGGLEVLELYQSQTDKNDLVVLDSSPEWLEALPLRFLNRTDSQ